MASCIGITRIGAGALQQEHSKLFGARSSLKKASFSKLRTRRNVCVAVITEEDVSSPSPSTVSGDSAHLKAELLSVVAGLDRGILASDEEVEVADAAARKLESSGNPVEFPRDLDKLQGKWRLVYSSAFASGNLGGSRPGPSVARFPLSLGQVYQRIDVLSREFDNIVELRLPTPWPFPPFETRATLAHRFELPGGSAVKIVFEKTSVKALGALSELPPFELPPLPEFLRSESRSGKFNVTYLEDDFRITRGDRGELRIFVEL